MLEPIFPDVIVFNFGLHDLNYDGKWPEEYTTPVEYEKNLRTIKLLLLSTGAKVGFLLTTPVPYEDALDDRIKMCNRIATHVMKEQPTVETADLYDWVIVGCERNCFEFDKDLGPHFTKEGYKYISAKVKQLILSLTKGYYSDRHKEEIDTAYNRKHPRYKTRQQSVRITVFLCSS